MLRLPGQVQQLGRGDLPPAVPPTHRRQMRTGWARTRLPGPLTGVVAAMARGAAGAQGSARTGSTAAEMEGATGVATGCRARSAGPVGPGVGGTAMVSIATLGQLARNCSSCPVQRGPPSCRAPTAASLGRATILPWTGRCTTPLLPLAWRVPVPRSRCFLCVVCSPPVPLAAPGHS